MSSAVYLYQCRLLQEEHRLKAKQAKEDLEEFLLTTDKMHSTIKYRSGLVLNLGRCHCWIQLYAGIDYDCVVVLKALSYILLEGQTYLHSFCLTFHKKVEQVFMFLFGISLEGQSHLCFYLTFCRKAEQIFAEFELWKAVPDRDRREIYEDILQQLEKREKVQIARMSSTRNYQLPRFHLVNYTLV